MFSPNFDSNLFLDDCFDFRLLDGAFIQIFGFRQVSILVNFGVKSVGPPYILNTNRVKSEVLYTVVGIKIKSKKSSTYHRRRSWYPEYGRRGSCRSCAQRTGKGPCTRTCNKTTPKIIKNRWKLSKLNLEARNLKMVK